MPRINHILIANEDWQIGKSLDALNDFFFGGFGMIDQGEHLELVWLNFNNNRELGLLYK